MPEDAMPRKTLWMLVYDDDAGRHLQPLYAVSEKDAQQQAQQWIMACARPIKFVELRAYPRGFVVQFGHGIPGNL